MGLCSGEATILIPFFKRGVGGGGRTFSTAQASMRHLHISHIAPYLPPSILHNLCFSFFQGITTVPREIENNTYANFLGK